MHKYFAQKLENDADVKQKMENCNLLWELRVRREAAGSELDSEPTQYCCACALQNPCNFT